MTNNLTTNLETQIKRLNVEQWWAELFTNLKWTAAFVLAVSTFFTLYSLWITAGGVDSVAQTTAGFAVFTVLIGVATITFRAMEWLLTEYMNSYKEYLKTTYGEHHSRYIRLLVEEL